MNTRIGLAAVLALASFLTGCSTALHRAAKNGRSDRVAALLDRGADVNAFDRFGAMTCGYTPLMAAACEGRLDTVKLLLDRGADINKNAKGCGWGPMEFALYCGKPDVAKLLFERGAEPTQGAINQTVWRGQTLLQRQLAQRLEQLKAGLPPVLPASAQSPAPSSDIDKPSRRLPERPADFAVVVGIGRYSDLPEAKFAERDGEAVRDHLMALGLPSRNVVHLSGEKAGYKGIEKFVETWLPKNVEEGSRVFFYFSGHGAPDPQSGQAYLIPYDGDPNFLQNTGYPIRRLYEKLGELKAKEVIVAMDACFSGAGGRSVLPKGARPLVMKAGDEAVPAKLSVFAAASGEQITSTLDAQGHGAFTYYFLKGLSGEAKDASGAVTARGLQGYLKPKVMDEARRQNRDQEPSLQGQADRELARF